MQASETAYLKFVRKMPDYGSVEGTELIPLVSNLGSEFVGSTSISMLATSLAMPVFATLDAVNGADVSASQEFARVVRRDEGALAAPFIARNAGLVDPGHALQEVVADGRYFEYAFDKVIDMSVIGATEDRTGTENTAYFDEAVEYSGLKGRVPIFWPAGTYQHDGLVQTDTAIPIIGSGSRSTILYLADGAESNSIAFTGTGDQLEGATVLSLQLQCNGAGQVGASHGIRGSHLKRGLFRDLIIEDAGNYGIGFQTGDFEDLLFDHILIINSGGDGIDFKNPNDESRNIKFQNITIRGFDTLAGTGKAGIDVRGQAMLSNIMIGPGITAQSAGIRFRPGDSDTGNWGGPRSSLVNFFVYDPGNTSGTGVQILHDNVNVSGGVIVGCSVGLQTQTGAEFANVSNVQCMGQGLIGLSIAGNVGTYTAVKTFDSGGDGILVAGTCAGNNLFGCHATDSENQNIQQAASTAVACATTANITLSGEQTIDGISTSASRVGVKDQTAPEENGIWVSAAGAWARATDADTAAELHGLAYLVSAGTVNADKRFRCTNSADITVGTTELTFVEVGPNKMFGGGSGPNTTGSAVSPATMEMHNVQGYRTQNRGTATLTSALTVLNVAHGLAVTPTRVVVTPTSNWGSMNEFWVDTKGGTNFRINADVAAGEDVTFDWVAYV